MSDEDKKILDKLLKDDKTETLIEIFISVIIITGCLLSIGFILAY